MVRRRAGSVRYVDLLRPENSLVDLARQEFGFAISAEHQTAPGAGAPTKCAWASIHPITAETRAVSIHDDRPTGARAPNSRRFACLVLPASPIELKMRSSATQLRSNECLGGSILRWSRSSDQALISETWVAHQKSRP